MTCLQRIASLPYSFTTINNKKASTICSQLRLEIQYYQFSELLNTTCQSITQRFIFYTIKIVYCQGDMFRPSLGHLQALLKNRSKSYLYFNALWDPKCLQIVLHECEIQYKCNTNCKHLGSHNALKYRQLLDLFSKRA